MIIFIIFLFSIIYAIKNKSLPYLVAYNFIISIIIYFFIYNGIDVLFKIDLSLPSDTYLYYQGYMSEWSNISNYTFPLYPYFLRIIEYPFHNALFVVWGQSVITFSLLDVIIKQKRNLIFFIFFHAIIYTTANMFKDNIVIISGLLSYIILNKTKSTLLQCGIITTTIALISAVRPFMGMFFPLALLPLWVNINNKKIKKSLFIIGCIIIVLIFISYKDYIAGIQNAFADDSSVQAGRSSPPIALIKVFLGPTPLHYLFHEKYMVQPFLDSQAILYTILHIIYYGVVAFWLIYFLYNWREICNIYKMTISRIFIFALALIQLVVYVMIYGSADIRQRAIIISFVYIFTLIDSHKIIIQKMSQNKFVIFIISLSLLLLLSFVS